MSSLWTPSGEHGQEPEPGPPPSDGTDSVSGPIDDAALAEELARVRAELAATPVSDIVANHAVGLWQLAVLHLTPNDGPPRFDEASVAIDAMAGLVDGLGDRLGRHAEALRDALSQLRLAYVQVQSRAGEVAAETPSAHEATDR